MESFLGSLDELKTVLGAGAAPAIEKAKAGLVAGLAKRDQGDVPAAVAHVAAAMAELAALGDRLGQAEGAMMRAITAQFVSALGRGDRQAIEENLERIQRNAGTAKKPGD